MAMKTESVEHPMQPLIVDDRENASAVECPSCKRPDGALNHVHGHIFVGWGHGWQPCPKCGGSGIEEGELLGASRHK
jgi:hypothetical protein